MSKSSKLSIFGGILLILGLYMALISNHYRNAVMGDAALGVAVLAPEGNSPEWQNKLHYRKLACTGFNLGLLLTALGIVFQTWAGIISENEKCEKKGVTSKHKSRGRMRIEQNKTPGRRRCSPNIMKSARQMAKISRGEWRSIYKRV